MIHLLHIISRLPIGGAERLLIGILRNLDRNRFVSIVCCIQDRGELADEVESLGIPVYALNFLSSGGYDGKIVPAVRDIINANNINLVHTHLYHANLYGRLAAFKEKIPAISSVHNTYTKRKWYRHVINQYLAKKTYAITAGSSDIKRDLISYDRVPDNKIYLLPNSIDTKQIRSPLSTTEAKKTFGFENDDFVIGNVGRAVQQKGQNLLLLAFADLLKNNPDIKIKLLLVGDGPLLQKLKEIALSLKIIDRVYFAGNIRSLATAYKAMDLFVMPSLWEGLSLAMLEAMAASLPVIATDVGGARDVLLDSQFGVLIPPNNHPALAAALNHLLRNADQRKRYAISAKERVNTNYDINSLTQKLSLLYLNAVDINEPYKS